jgi:hypothetical protein
MFEDRERCPYLKLAGNLRVYLKKLDEHYIPGNIITDHVKEKRGQELITDDAKIYVLYAGPVLEKNDWAIDLKRVVASCINEYYPKRPEFVIDLKEYIKQSVIADNEQAQQEDQLVVIPKRDEDQKKTN